MFFGFQTKQDILDFFDIPSEALDGSKVLFAWYGTEALEGKAFILLERDSQLYSVFATHCSCNGLEGQWNPQRTSWTTLKHLLRAGDEWPLLAVVPVEGSRFGHEKAAAAYFVALVNQHA